MGRDLSAFWPEETKPSKTDIYAELELDQPKPHGDPAWGDYQYFYAYYGVDEDNAIQALETLIEEQESSATNRQKFEWLKLMTIAQLERGLNAYHLEREHSDPDDISAICKQNMPAALEYMKQIEGYKPDDSQFFLNLIQSIEQDQNEVIGSRSQGLVFLTTHYAGIFYASQPSLMEKIVDSLIEDGHYEAALLCLNSPKRTSDHTHNTVLQNARCLIGTGQTQDGIDLLEAGISLMDEHNQNSADDLAAADSKKRALYTEVAGIMFRQARQCAKHDEQLARANYLINQAIIYIEGADYGHFKNMGENNPIIRPYYTLRDQIVQRMNDGHEPKQPD